MKSVKGLYSEFERQAMLLRLTNLSIQTALVWRLGCETGLRISDILSLRVQNATKDTFEVIESKTGKKRKIALSEALKTALRIFAEGMPKRGLIFAVTRQTIHRHIKHAAEFLGFVGIGCHSMRKIFAWSVYLRSFDIKEVKAELNHKFISTTILYLLDGFEWASRIAVGIRVS